MSKEPIGSVAEEAAKLFAVLQQAAARDPGGYDATPSDATAPDDEAGRTSTSSGRTVCGARCAS